MTAPTVFISYSHKDEKWKNRLVTHLGVLEKEGLLDLWDDRKIESGDDWRPEIEKAINKAAVAILMISANFLTSNFILDVEVPKLIARREKEGLRVIPLIVVNCIVLGRAEAFASKNNVFRSFLDGLGIASAHVFGVSMGGVIAQRFAAEHPDRTGRIVLVSTTGRTTGWSSRMLDFFETLATRLSPREWAASMATLSLSPAYFDGKGSRPAATALPKSLNTTASHATPNT